MFDRDQSRRQRNALRFPHDVDSERKYGRWSNRSGDDFSRMMERDDSPIRNWLEALYVDLESVVPMNGLDVERTELSYQQAYACGWLKRSDALQGHEPTVAYGMDCLEVLFHMLDAWYDRLVVEETELWKQRCLADLVLDPFPSSTRGGNYAHRLTLSWKRVHAEFELCPVCAGPMDADEHASYKCDCAIQYWAKNVAEKNCAENINDNAPRVTIWAHNGGRYDWLFVHRYLMERNLLRFCRVVRGAGKYYEIAYRGVFIFRDSLNFMMGSLERLGKDFQVETLKGIFPYRYLQNCSFIYNVLSGEEELRRDLGPSFFEVNEKIDGPMGLTKKRALTEDEYREFMEARDWRYDVRAETELYLKDDIKCLFQVMESFRGGWMSMPYQPEMFKYCTIGQMCHTYFLTHFLAPRTYCTLDTMEDSFIREALYGGRTEVFRRIAPDGSLIHYVDVNSLYPYVMESCYLPSGEPTWHFLVSDERYATFRGSLFQIKVVGETDFDSVLERLHRLDVTLYGFLEVDVTCPADMMYPVLPERMNGKNMFTNRTKHRMVYYSEELKFAIARGCRVTRVYGWCEWTPQKVYAKCISVLKAEKMRGEGKDVNGCPIPGAVKNASLRAAAKTAQNALYGKSIQFINESVQIVDNCEDLFRLVRTPESDVTIQPIYRTGDLDVVEVTVKPHKPKVQRRSCSAVGTAILAEAWMVLYSYFEEVQKVGGTILYCDTDSIVFAGDTGLPDRCVSDAVYGKMKVEIPSEEIERGGFVALAPKCYAFKLVDKSPYVKCKGVNLASNVAVGAMTELDELLELMESEEVLENLVGREEAEDALSGLSFDHLKMMVSGEKRKIVTKQMQFLKTRDRHIACIDTVKLLKDDFDKRWILSNGNTVPWSDVNSGIEETIVGEDVRRVSDFLQRASVEEIDFILGKCKSEWMEALVGSWLESGEFSAEFYKQYCTIGR
jgi:hypothetical protein